MYRLTIEIKGCLDNNLYYAALTLALSLPDICASIEHGGKTNRTKYKNWLDEYFFPLQDHYGHNATDVKDEIRMSAGDIYALRCTVLHNGMDEVGFQPAREILNKFRFVYSKKNFFIHTNTIIIESEDPDGNINKHKTMQLDTREFCLEIIDAVIAFIEINKNNENYNKLAREMMEVESVDDSFSI